MSAFRFSVTDASGDEVYSGLIGADSREEAKQTVEERVAERFEAYKGRSDRDGVDPADATTKISEVKD